MGGREKKRDNGRITSLLTSERIIGRLDFDCNKIKKTMRITGHGATKQR